MIEQRVGDIIQFYVSGNSEVSMDTVEVSRRNERKEAFDGLLKAYTALAEGWTNEKAKHFAYWEARAQLVSSPDVAEAITQLKASDPGGYDRTKAHDNLIASMRRDLELRSNNHGPKVDQEYAAWIRNERKEAFNGLLEAYAALAEGWTNEKAKRFAYWEARIQLVASPSTVDALSRLKDSEPDTREREIAHNDLMSLMREDLAS